ncbi:uncharacterized protein LOC129343443 [Eublepharis macularius]|uniref:Uncharacterized protein LOC129343443 n=1 Tax=Eublepharis macularius TaxID=481883 RepID=A0AA97LGU9_EUBMA|nr:uncharacterized protein LOC129343443 [Eublepharis macularius]
MAPRLATRAETSASLRFSSPVMGGVGSVAPVVIMVLLLLLCFPFRRKKRQLSTRILKKNSTSSELLSITKLEDGQSLQEKSLEDGTLHKGSSLPSNPAESQTNGCVVHHLPANSPQYPDTVSSNHQKTEKFEVTNLEHSISLGSQASCPNSTTPGPLQLRKLPMTPREEDISRTEPLNPSMDSRVYESIKDGERKLCSRDWSKGREGSDLLSKTSSCAQVGSVESGGKENRTAEVMGMHPWSGDASAPLTATLECNESHLQLQELTAEQDAPTESASDVEKKLRAMYARVCKKPKTDQQFQPANHNRPLEEGEEEPPPIPEKHFDDIYESIDLETQGSEMPSVIITPSDA